MPQQYLDTIYESVSVTGFYSPLMVRKFPSGTLPSSDLDMLAFLEGYYWVTFHWHNVSSKYQWWERQRAILYYY